MNNRSFDSRSFASAETIPVKVFINEDLWKSCVKQGRIIPVHLQLNPTNKCSFVCTFCSCGNRDPSLELNFDSLKEFLKTFKWLGGQSVTITGGGEPLLYSRINDLICYLYDLNIAVGVVTNGSAWGCLKPKVFSGVVWCRVSASDELPTQLARHKLTITDWLASFKRQIFLYPKVDWALSYVLSKRPNVGLIYQLIKFVNENNLTHMRIVSDILKAEQLETVIEQVKREVKFENVDDSLVNWQGRSTWVKGQKHCWISLAKPVLGADGYLYGCCGAQYALKEPVGDYPQQLRLGHMTDFSQIIASQDCFNGLICEKCFYKYYNDELDAMKNVDRVKHKEFI